MTLDERATRAVDLMTNAQYYIAGKEWLAAARSMGEASEIWPDIAVDVAQNAFNDGATKKAIAEALGVSPRMLAGMEKTTDSQD